MQTLHFETTVPKNREIKLNLFPFRPGEQVEVIVLSRKPVKAEDNDFPLKNTVIKYLNPTEPVADDDWNVLQ